MTGVLERKAKSVFGETKTIFGPAG